MLFTRNLSKMLTYMDAFSRFRTLNTLSQIETLLAPYTQLDTFEKAQLGTFLPRPHPTFLRWRASDVIKSD